MLVAITPSAKKQSGHTRLQVTYIVLYFVVLVVAAIDESLVDQTVSIGGVLQATTFVCNATGYPQPVVYWVRNGSNISTTDKYEITSTTQQGNCLIFAGYETSVTLNILNTEPIDSGEYTCVASNSAGTKTRVIELTTNGMYVVSYGL